MKGFSLHKSVRVSVRSVLSILVVCVVLLSTHLLVFQQGMVRANRYNELFLANDGCFYLLTALRVIPPQGNRSLRCGFDMALDNHAYRLATACIRDPEKVWPQHYNLLIRFQDYRNKFGTVPSRIAPPAGTPYYVDSKVAEAISLLESRERIGERTLFRVDMTEEGLEVRFW